jgi:uncharacterized repeat protein (TIGR03803 family)
MYKKASLIFTMLAMVSVVGFAASNKQSGTLTVLHSFTGNEGAFPIASLTADSAGNFYGTTQIGGIYGAGTAFQLSPTADGGWRFSLLHVFTGGNDGAQPLGSLVFDAEGNGYGTAAAGGALGQGVVYKLTRSALFGGEWGETVLYSFQGGADGTLPFGNVIFDAAGNLYGTTSRGGVGHLGCLSGCGTIYELSPTASGTWQETQLHLFTDSFGEGAEPRNGLVFDAAGNLYGTTNSGGDNSVDGCNTFSSDGCGTLFELAPVSPGRWKLTTLVAFNFIDGALPVAGVTLDGKGNLFGATTKGGALSGGTVFSMTQVSGQWKPASLYSFAQANSQPSGNLVVDDAGNLYGTTYQGGVNLWGSVFQLVPDGAGWTEQTLYSFPVAGARTGAYPSDGVFMDGSGNLFLTASEGGNLNDCSSTGAGCGTVIELSK